MRYQFLRKGIENLVENKKTKEFTDSKVTENYLERDKEMNIKRIISGIILFPLLSILLIFGNKYLVDVFISIVAIMSIHEFYKAFKDKAKPITWIGYLISALICFIHLVPGEYILPAITLAILFSLLVLFTQVVLTNMKTNIKDISISLLGICYIPFFLVFIPLIRDNLENGRILLWYILFIAWGTDIFAYFVGRKLGKHKFTEISPNKSIEGCIAGILGSFLACMVYTVICNSVWNLNINYLYILGISIFLSIISQIGDLAASSIKRYCKIKDFSNLIPGHGGLLDRIDSVIFILPFAYFLLSII